MSAADYKTGQTIERAETSATQLFAAEHEPHFGSEGAAVSVANLSVSYYDNVALSDVTFDIPPGSLAGIIGPNGAGKTTLLKAILDLVPRRTGKITLLGQPLSAVRKKIAYVPQRKQVDWTFPINVIDTVLLGTYPQLGLIRRPRRQEREWAYACLERVGMEHYHQRQIGELSGGQQQRVFIARALAQQAQLFFLDEPFTGIDMASEETIIDILKQLQAEGRTMLIVHHDLSKVRDYFTHIVMVNKRLVAAGPVEQTFNVESVTATFQSDFALLQQLGGGRQ